MRKCKATPTQIDMDVLTWASVAESGEDREAMRPMATAAPHPVPQKAVGISARVYLPEYEKLYLQARTWSICMAYAYKIPYNSFYQMLIMHENAMLLDSVREM